MLPEPGKRKLATRNEVKAHHAQTFNATGLAIHENKQ
jgi:hypothetical protein